ncbi:MAG: cupin domain-containing protein [Acidobacteriota bacterium]
MPEPNEVVNLVEKLALFDDHWSPRVVAELNDYQLKLAKIEGDFVWHAHDDTDEAFFVVQGSMAIEMRDRTVHLDAGDLFVVPKGVEHRPVAAAECHILLIEPRGVVNTGEAGGELQAPNDVWI